jgi:Uma2 family endonuclease
MTLGTPFDALPREIPVGPSLDAWRAMSPAAREAFVVGMNEALTEAAQLMSEGQPHKKAKSRAMDLLGLHFKAKGRDVYLAEELSVLYPGERGFAPDVMAVVDLPQPEEDERLSWVVADEGRGPDVVLEVLHQGDRAKDLVENVERFARLRIPEYFVYDRAKQRVHGYRLAGPDAKRYERIVPQAGRIASRVLGIDLAVQDGRLRFFDGMAELFGSDDLITRLTGMVESLEAKAEAEQARAEAEQARAEAEQARAEAEQARAEAEAAQDRPRRALEGMRGAVLAACTARFGPVSDALRAALAGCDEPARLQSSLLAAVTGGDPEAPLAALRSPA